MNSLHDHLDVLRSLDPAPAAADPTTPRARADLARILATDVGSPKPTPKPRPTHRRSATRLAVAAAVVLAVGSGLVLVPSLTGGDPAYATWTADPSVVENGARTAIADACRDSQRDGAGSTYGQELDTAATAVAERRGAWTLVLLAGDDGFSALCITDESRPLFQSSFGYVGVVDHSDRVPSRLIHAEALGVGSIDGHELSIATGPVEAGVVGVTYASAVHGAVSATVSHGHFALWLPGNDLENAPRDGAQVEVTYRDGTTETRTVELG